MAITDLTGTKWVWDSRIDPSVSTAPIGTWSINFESNSDSYVFLTFSYDPVDPAYNDIVYVRGYLDYDVAADPDLEGGVYFSNNYRCIFITGGADATNTTLIEGLLTHATQVPVVDLTNTTWLIGDEPSLSETGTYSINFTSNNNQYTQFQIDLPGGMHQYLIYGSTEVLDNYDGEYTWINNAYKTIAITNGTDVTNPDLVAWLTENATLQEPIQVNTYNLTHSLTNLSKGNITLQITPNIGYTPPSTLTVTNGTLVSYDGTTGIAVISGNNTTTVIGECVARPSGYSGDN